MNFKVGDKVRVIKAGTHEQEIGDTGVIESIETDTIGQPYMVRMDDDEDTHWFYEDEIVFLINKRPTKEELLKMPIGTKITTNKDEDNIFVKISACAFESNYDECVWDTDIEEDLSINDSVYGTKIIKIEVPTYETVYDSSEEVKEMTMDEICKALGYNVKIVKEEN